MTTAKIIYEGGLRSRCIHTRSGETIITDAPVDNHGKGEAFSPTDLLCTSLVCCMFTVMAIKAEKNGFVFAGAQADMQKIMAENPRRVGEIIVTIKMSLADYSPEQRKILEEAALNCPVAKSLSSEITQTVRFEY